MWKHGAYVERLFLTSLRYCDEVILLVISEKAFNLVYSFEVLKELFCCHAARGFCRVNPP